MGARGPQPTPTETLKARGSWRAKLRAGEVQYERGVPSCPTWLSREAKAEWKRQVVQLDGAGVLQLADRAILAAYCEAWGELWELSKGVKKLGYVKAIQRGLLSAKNRAADRLVKLADRFGFSPAARARVKATDEEEQVGGEETLRYFDGQALG